MKLFEVKQWQLQVKEEAWGYKPFKKLLTRDKTKDKEKALKEMFFIWNYCDVKSDYMHMTDLKVRETEIKKDIGLPVKWKIDADIKDAIELYERNSVTVVEQLYRRTLEAASAIGDYLGNTKELLAERDVQGKVVTDIAKITASVQKVPKLMSDLKAAYIEVVKEQEDKDNRQKGSKTFNVFEDGL